jgi:uncharacterized protein involved in type VI secretion and phage assembly
MAQTNFRFERDVEDGDQFSVVSFSGHEAISTLYKLQFKLITPVFSRISLETVKTHLLSHQGV